MEKDSFYFVFFNKLWGEGRGEKCLIFSVIFHIFAKNNNDNVNQIRNNIR